MTYFPINLQKVVSQWFDLQKLGQMLSLLSVLKLLNKYIANQLQITLIKKLRRAELELFILGIDLAIKNDCGAH